MVILSLIVKRTRVKALVKDKQTALEAFGSYVEVGGFLLLVKLLLGGHVYLGSRFPKSFFSFEKDRLRVVVLYAVNGWRCKWQKILKESAKRGSHNNMPKCMHIWIFLIDLWILFHWLGYNYHTKLYTSDFMRLCSLPNVYSFWPF